MRAKAIALPVRQQKGGSRVSRYDRMMGRIAARLPALLLACLPPVMVAAPQPAQAQFSDAYKFLDAVRKSDNDAVVKALEVPGVTPVNTKDRATGETALMITVARRDLVWSNYLLAHGAKPDLIDNQGRSALMLAVERRFLEGVQLLLSKGANPNLSNGSGETPLIRAVQLNDSELVRVLLGGGADPNRRDSLAGMSAIDYARRDSRSPAIVELLNSKAKTSMAKGVAGPQL